MNEVCSIQVVRLYRIDGGSKIKAFVDIAIGDFIVKGLKILEGKNGLFLSMPQEKAKDGKWYNSFFAATKEAQKLLQEVVLEAYQQ
ncbi:MAG: SpoVG family protein [Candidatus Omnitrophica bacterium]|nr:SpoVG family protein [Candidatus Omnitrophota bacterium]